MNTIANTTTPSVDEIPLLDAANADTPIADSRRLGRPLYRAGLALALGGAIVGVTTTQPTQVVAAQSGAAMAAEPTSSAGSPSAASSPAAATSAKSIQRVGLKGSAGADLTLGATSSTSGDTISWELTVMNDGPDDEGGPMTLVATLPDVASSVAFSGDDWECDYDTSSATLNCVNAGGLQQSKKSDLSVQAVVANPEGVSLTASLIGTHNDPDLTNNSISQNAATTSGVEAKSATTSRGDTTESELPETGPGLAAWLAAFGAGMVLFGHRMVQVANVRTR